MKDIKEYINEGFSIASAEISELRKLAKKEFNDAVKNHKIKNWDDVDKFSDEFCDKYEKDYSLAFNALDRSGKDVQWDWFERWAEKVL